MMNQKITKYVANWFARADEDLDIAQLILGEERPYNPACFHEQQAAEKYLKGFLAHHEKHVRKIHDLNALLQECIKIDQSFEGLRDSAYYLGRFYVESRYPDDYIEFTYEDAKQGLDAALRIKEFVLAKIKPEVNTGFGAIGVSLIVAAILVIGGFFGYQYLKLQKIQEEVKAPAVEPPVAPSVQIKPQTAEIDTSNWKTYRNEQYGFEVRYPNNSAWQIEENSPEIKAYRYIHIYLMNPPPMRIGFGSEFVAITVELNTTLAQERERIRSQNPDNVKEAKRIYIGDEAADHYFHTETPTRTHFFWFEHEGLFYKISTTNYDMLEVKQILSTFKFIK